MLFQTLFVFSDAVLRIRAVCLILLPGTFNFPGWGFTCAACLPCKTGIWPFRILVFLTSGASFGRTLRCMSYGVPACRVKAWGIVSRFAPGCPFAFPLSSLARADVRVRVREGVIRVSVSEPGVRAVIRIPAPQEQLSFPATCPHHACRLSPLSGKVEVLGFKVFSSSPRSPLGHFVTSFPVRYPFRSQSAAFRNKQGESRCPRPRSRRRNTS